MKATKEKIWEMKEKGKYYNYVDNKFYNISEMYKRIAQKGAEKDVDYGVFAFAPISSTGFMYLDVPSKYVLWSAQCELFDATELARNFTRHELVMLYLFVAEMFKE